MDMRTYVDKLKNCIKTSQDMLARFVRAAKTPRDLLLDGKRDYTQIDTPLLYFSRAAEVCVLQDHPRCKCDGSRKGSYCAFRNVNVNLVGA